MNEEKLVDAVSEKVASDAALIAKELASENKDRLDRVDLALIQINHATEVAEKFIDKIEGWNVPEFKGNIEGQLIWIKMLMAGSVVAAFAQIVLSMLKGG